MCVLFQIYIFISKKIFLFTIMSTKFNKEKLSYHDCNHQYMYYDGFFILLNDEIKLSN